MSEIVADRQQIRATARAGKREIWLISMAVNFALGKEIFCYMWLNEFHVSRYEMACEHGSTDLLRTVIERGKLPQLPFLNQ